ncbi:hypothetical protein TWF694_005277 [Orbilia ellipsospora]|uniref:Uncharacterized protein n=1 Tax=Orbilia ellipsospora TaxID=2528407 RepID=A0AAV9WTP6_9PEZI
MAEFLVSLNPANWPKDIPLSHTLLIKNDAISFKHIYTHEISLNLNISETTLKLVKELRWWFAVGVVGYIAWKGWERWLMVRYSYPGSSISRDRVEP